MKKTRKGALNKALIERCSPAMLQLIQEVGGVHALAQRVDMWYTVLYGWLSGKYPPTPESEAYRALSLLLIEKTGMTLEEALGFNAPDDKTEQLDSMPEGALIHRFDEDAMIAKIDVQRAIERIATKKPQHAEAIRRYHGIGVDQEDYIDIAQRWGITYKRVWQVANEGQKMLARKLKVYEEALSPADKRKTHRRCHRGVTW